MTSIQKSVDVRMPLRAVYNQWTQFEAFPRFMGGVHKIRQLSPTRTHWETRIGGVTRAFEAEITEQRPDERIAWRSVHGAEHGGVVTFHRIDEETTRVHLQMEYHPDSLPEKIAAGIGMLGRQISADLQRFGEFLEGRGQESGGWRGEVPRAGQQGEPRGAGVADRGGTAALSNPPTDSTGDGVLSEARRREEL
ncbi:MAG: cyclase [Pseudonocardiaceae bacterium]|nr:cyclase [Pseudonocardiaceae bacterium]